MPAQTESLATILRSFGVSPYGRDQTAERTNMLLETLLRAKAAPAAPEVTRPLVTPEEEALLAEAYPVPPMENVPALPEPHSFLGNVAGGRAGLEELRRLRQRIMAKNETGPAEALAARAQAKLQLLSGRQSAAMREADQTTQDATWLRSRRAEALDLGIANAEKLPPEELFPQIVQARQEAAAGAEAKQSEQERHTAEMERHARATEERLLAEDRKRQAGERGALTQTQRISVAQAGYKIKLHHAERDLASLNSLLNTAVIMSGGLTGAQADPAVVALRQQIDQKQQAMDEYEAAIEAIAAEALMPEAQPAPAVAIPPPKHPRKK